jgi:hypothetical protein
MVGHFFHPEHLGGKQATVSSNDGIVFFQEDGVGEAELGDAAG